MKIGLNVLVALVTMAFAPVIMEHQAFAAEDDAGHGADYRTFHADGKADMGKIADSSNSERVMYLAGNQFMIYTHNKLELVGAGDPKDLGLYAKATGNRKNAKRYLAYLATDNAQNVYATYGFIKAEADELKLKPIFAAKK